MQKQNSIIGRTANQNEIAIFEFNENNAFVVKESFKIFGMLSVAHQYDIIKILGLIAKL